MKALFFSLISLLTATASCMITKTRTSHIAWSIAATLPPEDSNGKQPGVAGAWAGVNNNALIVAGGANFPGAMPWQGGKKKYQANVYVFQKDGKGNLNAVNKTFQLPFPVAYGASCSTTNGMVCAGGENEKGLSNKVLMMQWNAKTEEVIFKDLPDLPVAVTNASITVDKNIVYLAGGETTAGVCSQFLCLDINNTSKGWKQLAPLPKAVSNSVMVVQSANGYNSIYLIGGRKKNDNGISDLYSSVYQFDIEGKQWKEKKSLPYALSAGTGVATVNQAILLFGGDRGKIFHETEKLIAAIGAEKDAEKKDQLNQQKIALQTNHPGFSNEVLVYNTITDEWKTMGSILFVVPVTTNAVKWDNDVFITSGEVKAGVRTPQILKGTLETP